MPDGSQIKPMQSAERLEQRLDQMLYHADRLRALTVAMHEVLPDHVVTKLDPQELANVRTHLLDLAMEETVALLEAGRLGG